MNGTPLDPRFSVNNPRDVGGRVASEGRHDARRTHPMLDANDIAKRLRCGVWTARQRLAFWLAQQEADATLPRVTLHRSGGRGRPSYRVEPTSFVRWLRGESRPSATP
jgi:hypothetical protein